MGVRTFGFGVLAAAAFATMVSAASAAVYTPQQQLPQQTIADFNKSPTSLLQQFPSGGAQMISRVRDLGASDPSTLPGLISLLKTPGLPVDQRNAIVAGLAQVARLASKTDQAYADEIQRAVVGTNDAAVIAAYQAATGDVAIAAAGGGGAGGGGSGAGGPTGSTGFVFGGNNSGGATTIGGLHFATSGSSSSSGGVSGASSSGGSVSPR